MGWAGLCILRNEAEASTSDDCESVIGNGDTSKNALQLKWACPRIGDAPPREHDLPKAL